MVRSRRGCPANSTSALGRSFVSGRIAELSKQTGAFLVSELSNGQMVDDVRLAVAGRVPVHFLGSVDQQAVAQLIGACDLVSIPYRQTAYTQATQACKIAEYLACRVPVAATRVGQATAALADIPQALCQPDDADDLARVLKAQIAAPVLAPVPTELAWETLAGRLETELEGVLASRRS